MGNHEAGPDDGGVVFDVLLSGGSPVEEAILEEKWKMQGNVSDGEHFVGSGRTSQEMFSKTTNRVHDDSDCKGDLL